MKGFRSPVIAALAGSALLVSGLSLAAAAGGSGMGRVATAGTSAAAGHPCANTTLIEACVSK
jgi:hypothetical protein